jgi:hypothetical protein
MTIDRKMKKQYSTHTFGKLRAIGKIIFSEKTKMDYVEIAKTEEIPVGSMKAFVIQGNDILVGNYQGKYYADSPPVTLPLLNS